MNADNMPYAEIERGCFLIATPEIESGIFFHSVILLCEHSSTGSFGIVLNKPLEMELPQEVLSVKHLANPNVRVLSGGPVQTNQMMLLHNDSSLPHHTLEICPNVYLGGDLQFLQHSLSSKSGPSIHLCFGYAGWGMGQLEREFLDGSWFLSRADHSQIFGVTPEKLWQSLLREMGGRYATLSMIPEDLTLN